MFKKRILASLIAIFVIGVVSGIFMFDFDTFYFRAFFTIALAVSVLFAIFAARSDRRSKMKPFIAVALAVAAFSFGILRVSIYNDSVSKNKIYDNKTDDATFEVAEVGTSWVDVRVLKSEIGVPNTSSVRVYLNQMPEGLIPGDEFRASIQYQNVNTRSQYSNGIDLVASGEITEMYDADGLFYNIRKSVNENCKAMFKDFDDAEAISKAVIIGDRTGLDSYIYSLYRNVGISHVLAISGLHISIIAFGIQRFLMLLTVDKRLAGGISAIFIFCYVALVGFSYGAVRSSIMLLTALLSTTFRGKADGLTYLLLALMGLLLTNPYSVLSKGLQLSFLSTLGILMSENFFKRLEGWRFRKKRTTKGFGKICVNIVYCTLPSLLVTFSAIVFSFPVLCFGFDSVSYISPLMNFISVSIYSLAIELTFVAFLIAPISITVASIIAYPAGLIFDFVTNIARWFYDADIGITSVHQPYMVIPMVLSLLMIFALLFLIRHRLKAFVSLAILFCISIFVCVIYNNNMVSQKIVAEYSSSSSEYVYLQNKNESVYFDIGGYISNSESIYHNGKTSLDRYVVIDYDGNTYSRFKRMCDDLKVYQVYLPEPKDVYQFSILSQIKELAKIRNYDIITYDGEFTSEFSDKSAISVFYPDAVAEGESLIIFDIKDKRLRFVGERYKYSVNADVAVLMNGYSGNYHDIISDSVVAHKKYIEENEEFKDKLISFSQKIRLEFIDEESAFLIYEP